MPSTMNTEQGYRHGRRAIGHACISTATGALNEARAWRRAQDDHAETSYYGAAGVRYWRAYWLGVARERRSS